MFLYDLDDIPGRSLYERLTACIRADILSGALAAGTRLPSKRRAAVDLGVSVVTVKEAYEQLLAEGYLVSRERSGYFVAQIDRLPTPARQADQVGNPAEVARTEVRLATPDAPSDPGVAAETDGLIDLVQNSAAPDLFPLSVWNRLSRRIFNEQGEDILRRVPYNGARVLREALADILYASRGIAATPDQILISSGNQTLYSSLLLLLGRDRVFGVEDPGYRLVPRLYRQHGAEVCCLPMDEQGVIPEALEASGTSVLHISPSHHFPTGIVTPVTRRQELLRWAGAQEGRYILEDDYDSEFRLGGRPIPSLGQLDREGRVIYMNTFSKTIAPSLRIGYAILPPALADTYRRTFGYLACPVPAHEQYTLAAFIREGYFERHINRMRTHYRGIRDALLRALAECPRASRYKVSQADSGLHFLLRIDTVLSGNALCRAALDAGIRVHTVEDYRDTGTRERRTVHDTDHGYGRTDDARTLVISYTGLSEERVEEFVRRLDSIP